jgi:RNA polymerase sigma-70 factor, ECF subfamily
MLGREQYARLLEPLLSQAAGYSRSILRDRQDAQDAVQQAALRGLERIRTYDTNRPFKGWWFSILHNCCIDTFRQSKIAMTGSLECYDPADSPVAEAKDWQHLSVAMTRLSEDHREVLRLRYLRI